MRTFNHLILAFFLVLTGCTSVEPRVAKTQLPDGTFGYIAGEFKHDERELYALSLLNINTDTNYLMASGSPAKKIKMGFASEIVMIKVPPGLYEIKYWVQIDRSGIGPIGSRARFKKDSIIAQQFKVTENSVIYLGNIEFTQERVPGGSMETVKLQRLSSASAEIKFLEAFLAFANLSFSCPFCAVPLQDPKVPLKRLNPT